MARAHALVVGAGPAGLLAARVLAESFERVTVLEREPLPIDFDYRGRPQDRPVDGLQPPGAAAMEEVDPGLLEDLEDAGVPVLTRLDDLRLEMAGHVLCQSGELCALIHRPGYAFLVDRLRSRRPARVEIRYRTTGTGLILVDGRVAGVAAETAEGPAHFTADLVVDAAGPAGHTGVWLSRLGLAMPEEDRLDIGMRMVSLVVHRPEGPIAGVESLYLNDAHPGQPWGLAAGRIERDRWILSVFGYGGNHPPVDRPGVLEFVSGALPEAWRRLFVESDPYAQPVWHDFPTAIRRRYELVRGLPAGLIPIGDSWCYPNPVHAQGLTLAAQAALALRDALRGGDDAGLAGRYLEAAAPVVNRAWQFGTAADRAIAQVSGVAPSKQKEQVLHGILTAAERDPEVVNALLQINWGATPNRMASMSMVAKASKARRVAKRDAKREAKQHAKQQRRRAS